MKLALLFLTRRNIKNIELWEKFIADSQGKAVMYAHVKEPQHVTQPTLHAAIIPTSIPTKWGDVSLVRAQNLMLRHAMQDSSITHFAIVSEACIPIKTWSFVEAAITKDARSRMELIPTEIQDRCHKIRRPESIPNNHWKLHSQWVLLNRKMVELILSKDYTELFESTFASDEHYYGTVFSMHELDPILVNTNPLTLVDWSRGRPTTYTEITPSHQKILDDSLCFFARKFETLPKQP